MYHDVNNNNNNKVGVATLPAAAAYIDIVSQVMLSIAAVRPSHGNDRLNMKSFDYSCQYHSHTCASDGAMLPHSHPP
jgi:hypothetical protein